MWWHYKIIDLSGNVVLDSSDKEDFYGYSDSNKAYMVGLAAKRERNLSDLHTVETFEVIPDCVLNSFENSLGVLE